MINLVRVALRRPYTMAVTALLIMLMGAISVTRMIVDIFPNIDIPVVYVAWSYNGLNAEDMERRVVLVSERAYSTTVNGIERIESLSIPGQGILKIYFQQGADVGAAIAQISAQSNAVLRIAPPGMQPPNIIQFNASNVPVVQVTLNSRTLAEQMLSDYANQFLRLRLFTIPGLSIPGAFGGKQRQIIVEVDSGKASSKGLSQMDVVNAMGTTNVIVPAGIARLGPNEYNIQLNSSPKIVDQFNFLPVGVRDGIPVLLGDVAKVSDSFAQQTNIVRINGQRASFLPILKNSTASTLTVVNAVKAMLPELQAIAPEGMELAMDFDQSVFVRSAVENVVKEAILASILVSLMILIFLGSWRNTLIVAISIPLSIFAGIAGLYMAGQTINLMTLGGLALAIGMLVDNATVVMENIHRNQTLGKSVTVAILDGSVEVIQPLTVATLCICIVFFPVVFLVGPARFLFIPLAITVVLAMLASYVLVVHGRAGAGAATPEGRASPRGGREGRLGPADGERVRSRIRARQGRLRQPPGRHPGSQEVRARLLRRLLRHHRCAGAGRRNRLLPDRRRRHPQAARARPEGPPPRRHRGDHDQGRGSDPRDHSDDRIAQRESHHRCTGRAQSRVRAERQRQRRRWRDADIAEQAASAIGALPQAAPRAAGARFPRRHVLFPDRGYRQPGAQLRPVGADRYPDPGSELHAVL